jgi:hypothetical protein
VCRSALRSTIDRYLEGKSVTLEVAGSPTPSSNALFAPTLRDLSMSFELDGLVEPLIEWLELDIAGLNLATLQVPAW